MYSFKGIIRCESHKEVVVDAVKVLEFVLADLGLFEQALGALIGKKEEVALALAGLLKGRPKLREEMPMIEVLLYALQHGDNLFNDPLTGVRDRRLYEAGVYEGLVAEAKRHKHPLSVVVLDIDGFKAINDGPGGHSAGDEVLKRVALVLRQESRETDIVIRFGGDEFLLILPYADEKGARIMMRRVQEAQALTGISVSFGVVSMVQGTIPGSEPPDTPNSLKEMVRWADGRMYSQKKGGGQGGVSH